jgi:hypothetical protein
MDYPNCEEINTLKNPITDTELSFIEFMASVFNERISYLFAIILIWNPLLTDIPLAATKTIMVNIWCCISRIRIIDSYKDIE